MELFQDLRDGAFGRARQLWRDDQAFLQLGASERHAKGDADILRGFKATHEPYYLPLAQNYTGRGVNQLLSGDTPDFQFTLPKLHGDPDESGMPTESEKDREDVEYLRRCARALWEQVNTIKMGLPLHSAAKNGLGLGVACIAYPLMIDRYPDEPQDEEGNPLPRRTKKQKELWDAYEAECASVLPWDIHPVGPLNILFDPDHDAPEYYFEYGQISRRVLRSEYPWLPEERLGGQPAGDAGQTLERVIYVSKDWWGVFVDGLPVLTEQDADDVVDGIAPNTMGYLWYQCAESGFGVYDEDGRLEYRLMGMVRAGRDLIAAKIEAFNIIQQHMLDNVLWMPDITGAGPDGQQIAMEELGEQEWGPDKVVFHSDRVKVGFVQTPPLPPVVLQNLEEIDKNIVAQFGPEVLSGQYRDEPASKQAQRVNQAMLPFKPMEDGLEQMLAQATLDMFYSCRNVLKRKVTLRGASGSYVLDPNRVPLGLKNKCTLSPMTKVMQQADWEIKAAQYQLHAISQEDLMRDGAKVENVERTMVNILKDTLRNHPAVADAGAQILISGIQNTIATPSPSPASAPPAPAAPVQAQAQQAALPGFASQPSAAPVPQPQAQPQPALNGAALGGPPQMPPQAGF